MSEVVRKLLERLTRDHRPRTIRRDVNIEPPYLTRWYLNNLPKMPDGSFPFDDCGTPREGVVNDDESYTWLLHRFGQDDDPDVHCHPWTWGLSFILSGGYIEERYDAATNTYTTRVLKAPAINFLRHGDFHRVTLIGGQPCWTLFLTGKRVSSWGFIDRKTGLYTHWATYIEKMRKETK